eukprot:134059_1
MSNETLLQRLQETHFGKLCMHKKPVDSDVTPNPHEIRWCCLTHGIFVYFKTFEKAKALSDSNYNADLWATNWMMKYLPSGYITLLDRHANYNRVSKLFVDKCHRQITITRQHTTYNTSVCLSMDTESSFNEWISAFSVLGVEIQYVQQLKYHIKTISLSSSSIFKYNNDEYKETMNIDDMITFQYWIPKPLYHPTNKNCIIISTHWNERRITPAIYKYDVQTNEPQIIYKYKLYNGSNSYQDQDTFGYHGQVVDTPNNTLILYGSGHFKIFDLNTNRMTQINDKNMHNRCNLNYLQNAFIPSPMNEIHVLDLRCRHCIFTINKETIEIQANSELEPQIPRGGGKLLYVKLLKK